nr:MAG TPA: hypothetical protein [Caudoviricetes sp.]
MYTGSFAASLKGIAYTRGFVIFTRVRVNKHIPPFTGECFSLFPFAGFICCGPCWLGMPACLPHGWQATVRFRYAAQPTT